MGNSSNKDYGIEILRVLFTFMILILHVNQRLLGDGLFCKVGGVGVEFFFVLSGILMAKKIQNLNKNGKSENLFEATADYVKKSICRYYLFMFRLSL